MTLLTSINAEHVRTLKARSRVVGELSAAFDRTFTVYASADDDTIYTDLTGETGAIAPTSGTRSAGGLAQHRSDRAPRVLECSAGRWLLIVPLRHRPDGHWKAAAIVDGTDPRRIARLAAAVVERTRLRSRLRRRRRELDAYADRVSRDFEELWWLRKLAENIELCEVTSGPETVAAALLPSLRDIIEAEALVMIRAAAPDGPCETETPPDPEQWCWSAGGQLRESACRQLLAQFGSSPAGGPVVRNGLLRTGDNGSAAIDSFILVPIAKGIWHFGWLLAVNKASGDAGGHTAGLSEPEFGSFETGLLSAAAVMLAGHARNTDLFRQRELLLIGVIRALVNAIDAKDAYTCGHSDRVARIAMRLAEEVGLDHQNCLEVYMTGLLHDVGKIGVPDAILCKPDKLTDEEFAVVKRHPSIGYQILKHVRQLSYVLPGVLHHHEAMTGGGYPFGLAGESIPLAARILAVADSYDAMTSSRSYRAAMPFDKAEKIIREGAGTQWDAEIVAALLRALDDIHNICIDSESRQHALHEPSGDGLDLPADVFAGR